MDGLPETPVDGAAKQPTAVQPPTATHEPSTIVEPQLADPEPVYIKAEPLVRDASEQSIDSIGFPSQREESASPAPMLCSDAERMAAKDVTILDALQRLRNIHTKVEMTRVQSSDIDLMAWATQLESVEADHIQFEFLVGAAGNTGMGKSSLLNALIGEAEDLAPSSQNGACTAAVCCFHYHEPTQAEHRFLARVNFKSKAAVDAELEAYFFEHKRIHDAAALDGEPDNEIRAQRDALKEQMRVIEGWTGLKRAKIEELGLSGQASEITKLCDNGAKFFNYQEPAKHKVHDLGATTPKKFLYTIRPYVGNVNRKEKMLLLWPLVDIVHIYVDAPLLRNGVVLVDLPGEMDATESRARIAKNYYNKLDRLMIVTPHDRACDDRTAADLIRDDQLVGLEADGKMNNDGFCVVVTKVDQLEWEDFANNEWDPEDISVGFPALFHSFKERQTELEALKERIEELRDELEEYCPMLDRLRNRGLALPENPAQDPEVNNQLSELYSSYITQREIELDIARLDEECLRECLDARNQDIIAKMKDLVTKRRQDVVTGAQRGDVSQVNVFPVSSRAHRNALKQRPQPAFPDVMSTGIRPLEEWITEGASEKRKQHLDDLLNRCHVLFDAIEGWAVEAWFVKLRLPETDYPGIEQILKYHQKTLKSDFEMLDQELQNYIKSQDMVASEFYVRATARCVQKFVAHVKSYNKSETGNPLSYATYAACIRRNGGTFKTSKAPRQTYCWQEKTNTYYWRSFSKHWGQAYSERIPRYVQEISSRYQKRVGSHVAAIAASTTLPEEYRDAFKQYSFKIENLAQLFKSRLHQVHTDFRKEIQQIRVQSKEWINEPMFRAYEEARNIKGRGMNARQIELMETFAKNYRQQLFDGVESQMGAALQQAQHTFQETMSEAIDSFVVDVSIVEQSVGKNVCSLDKSLGQADLTTADVQSVKDSVKQDVTDWRRTWQALLARMPAEKAQPKAAESGMGRPDNNPLINKKKRVILTTHSDAEAPPAKVPRTSVAASPPHSVPSLLAAAPILESACVSETPVMENAMGVSSGETDISDTSDSGEQHTIILSDLLPRP